MSGTVPPPPPPPGGSPDDEPTAPLQEQHPATMPTPVQAPVQRVSAATRKPPAISPANQFAQAVTPAPAAPGAPRVQSVQRGGDPTVQQQYYPDQYQQQGYQQQGGQYQQQQYQQGQQGQQGQYQQGGQYQQQPAQYQPQGYDQYGQPVYAGQQGGYQQDPPRKKLSPGWIAFIALDVLLVVAAIVFAVNLLGTPDTSASGGGESPAAEQSAEPEAEEGLETDGGAGVETFAAPSLNITCTISADAATCGIAELDQEPAPDASCGGASGFVAKVDPTGNVTQPCVGKKDQPKKAAGDVAILKYEATKKAHGFTCKSAQTGMTCVADATGSGFSIARAGIGSS